MILIIYVKKKLLKKGQIIYVTLNNIPHRKSIKQIVFYNGKSVYATSKLFGITREKCDLINIYTDLETGMYYNKKRRLLENKNKNATWINWDYPVYFDKPILINENVQGFRIANNEEELLMKGELEKCKMK